MSCCLPKVEPHVKVPLYRSCNCCDNSKFSLICCGTRPKSPTPLPKEQDNTIQEVTIPVFHEDKSTEKNPKA
jgi:hypothetical protein